MRQLVNSKIQFFLDEMIAILGLLLISGAMVACANEKAAPVVLPFEGAPVTAVVDGKMLFIANNSEHTIYLQIFPTDILPVIEWAPCIAPETCPDEQRIDPRSEKRINLRDIVRDQTVSITVFWWIYLEKAPGATVAQIKMDEIVVPLP